MIGIIIIILILAFFFIAPFRNLIITMFGYIWSVVHFKSLVNFTISMLEHKLAFILIKVNQLEDIIKNSKDETKVLEAEIKLPALKEDLINAETQLKMLQK